jgi:hypothetical protein
MNRSSHFEEIFLVTAVRFATTHALSAIQARTQRNSFNDPQQMRIGISLPVGEHQSIARTPFVTSRQPLGKLVIDADVALFAILHLPVITFPLAIDLDFFGPQIDVRPLHMRPFTIPKIDPRKNSSTSVSSTSANCSRCASTSGS